MPNRTTPRNDDITGTPLDDLLFGFGGDDILRGGAGNDVFYEGFARWVGEDVGPEDDPFLETGEVYDFGAGSDTILGGDGYDVVRYDLRIGGLTIDVDAGRVRIGSETDTLRQIEEIRATNERDVAIAGDKGITLKMQGGRDRVEGMAADGFYHGGRGLDTLDMSGESGAVTIDTARRFVSVEGEGSGQIRSFERIVGSGTQENRIDGSDAAERFFGGAAHDRLNGLGGDDVLVGLAGDDALSGGLGHDRIEGGAGQDTIEGGAGDDTIVAGLGHDTVDGGDGDDTILTGDGADTVFDISGTNIITTGRGGDTVTVGFGTTRTGAGFDTIYLAHGGTVHAGGGRDTIRIDATTAVAHGDDGNDLFTLTVGGFFQGAILGGAGEDSLVLTRGAEIWVRSPLEDETDPTQIVSGVENILGSEGGDTVSIEEDGVSAELRAGSDSVTLYANGSFVDLGGGNNDISIYGSNAEIRGGANSDGYYVSGSGTGISIVDVGGADRLELSGEAVTADLGDGRDAFYLLACFDPEATSVDLGDGVDYAFLSDNIGFLDLGAGADRVEIDNVIEARITTGAGADVIELSEFVAESDITITDFDVGEDRFDLGEIDTLAEFEIVRQEGEDVLLFNPVFEGSEFGLRIVLEDTQLGDVTDAIFL